MKIFRLNVRRLYVIDACDAREYLDRNRHKVSCPLFSTCCESGDMCQAEDRENPEGGRLDGFPVWCPLDEAEWSNDRGMYLVDAV